MNLKKINGMDIIDICHFDSKTIKELKKMKNIEKMTTKEMNDEFIDIQSQLDNSNLDELTFAEEVLCARQSLLKIKIDEAV